MRGWALLLLLLLLGVGVLLAQGVQAQGSVSAAVSTATVSAIVSRVVPQIEAGLQGLAISDVDADQDGFDVKLTSMTVRSLSTSSVSITTGDNRVNIALNGIHVSLHGHYKVQEDAIGHITVCSGDFDVSATANSLSVSVTISQSNGVPVVNAGNASFDLGDFDINFCSAVGWIVNLFKGTIKHKVQDAVTGQLASQINQIAQQEISKLSFSIAVTPFVGVDYHLASNVIFSATQGSVSILGSIFNPKTGKTAPFQPTNIPALTVSESLSVAISDALPQGALWSYYSNNALNYKFQGKSGLLSDFIITANTTALPTFKISADGASIDWTASIGVEFTPFPDYGFEVDLSVLLDAELLAVSNGTGTYLYAQIPVVDLESLQFDFVLKNHSKLPFDESALLPFLNAAFKELLVVANPALANFKLPLPSIKYLTITGTKLTYGDRFVMVNTGLAPALQPGKYSGKTRARRLRHRIDHLNLRGVGGFRRRHPIPIE